MGVRDLPMKPEHAIKVLRTATSIHYDMLWPAMEMGARAIAHIATLEAQLAAMAARAEEAERNNNTCQSDMQTESDVCMELLRARLGAGVNSLWEGIDSLATKHDAEKRRLDWAIFRSEEYRPLVLHVIADLMLAQLDRSSLPAAVRREIDAAMAKEGR